MAKFLNQSHKRYFHNHYIHPLNPQSTPTAKMKREGRQHGMVLTYPIIQSAWNAKRIHKFESPATAGPFTRVSQKPTNHSKFTGKCGRPRCASCHIHPAGKSKDKTKGAQKLKSCDVRPGLNLKGFSATGILDHLADDYVDDGSYDDDDNGVYGYGGSGSYSYADREVDSGIASKTAAIQGGDESERDCGENGGGDGDGDGGDDDERMSFYDVGFIWESVEGDADGWCVVSSGGDLII